MKILELQNGHTAIVDDDDFNRLKKFKWFFKLDGYATRHTSYRRGHESMQLLHRLIMAEPHGYQIDHKNGNRLDCRKVNLRIVTNQQNGFNRGLPSNNKSGAKGVCWDKARQKWTVGIGLNGKRIALGRFSSKEAAIAAYNTAAAKLHGEFARLN